MSEGQNLDISSAAQMLLQDIPVFISQNQTQEFGSNENLVLAAINTPAPEALLQTLKDNGVSEIDVSGRDMGTPYARIQSILSKGYYVMKERGIPSPDLREYQSFSPAEFEVKNDNVIMVEQSNFLADSTLFTLDSSETLDVPYDAQYALIEAQHDAYVEAQISGTNFCKLNVADQFQHFLRWQDVERAADDDFVSERVTSRDWSELPEEIRNFEPNIPNIFGFRNPYSGWVDDLGAHEENQRFPGGYHLGTEHDLTGSYVHFDAHDPLMGPGANILHGFEVDALSKGVIDNIHHPDEHVADPRNEGRFPDWEHYEDHCAGL